MKLSYTLALFLFCASALAQSALLGNKVILPESSRQVASDGQQEVPSAPSGNSGAQVTPASAVPNENVTAEEGTSETFFSDQLGGGTNIDGSTHVDGWNAEANVSVVHGHIVPKTVGTSMALAHTMISISPTSLMAQATMYFGAAVAPNGANCMGFTNAPAGQISNATNQRLAVCFGNDMAYLVNGSSTTALFSPNVPVFCTVTLWLTASGKLDVSIVKLGTNQAVTDTFTGIVPPAALRNFEISGLAATDQQENARYAVTGDDQTEHWPMAYDATHPGLTAVLTSGTAAGVFALIPPGYQPGGPNKTVVYMHGLNEPGFSISCQAPYTAPAPYSGCNVGVANVAQGLMNAGYVVLGINHTNPGCYGNAACVAELQSAISEFSEKLSLSPDMLYGFADSMGGFEMLNAIMQGVFSPKAIAGCCMNTNMAWDYLTTYTLPGSATPTTGAGSAFSLINKAYDLANSSDYAAATSGFDPMLATGTALTRLAAVPAMLWASNSDRTVYRAYNADAYADLVNAAGGHVQVETCTGAHEDRSCFVPEAVVAFFNSH